MNNCTIKPMTKSIFLVLIAATAATQLQSLKLGRRAKVS